MSRIILSKANEIIKTLDVKRVVLIGDYTDQWGGVDRDDWYQDDLRFLYNWKQELSSQEIEVVVLSGNHDIPYLINQPVYYSVKNPQTFQWVREILFDLELQIAYQLDDYLLSHAGYTENYQPEEWHFRKIIPDDKISLEQLHNHVGLSRGGRYITGSPIWADLNRDLYERFNNSYPKQIVGHTPVENINTKRTIIGVDTFSLTRNHQPLGNGDMLLYEDGKLTVVENKDWKTNENQRIIKEVLL